MAVSTAAPERFDLGRVFSGGFEIAGRRPVTFSVLAAIFGFLPTAATLWVTTRLLPQPTPGVVDLGGTLQRLGVVELMAVIVGGLGWMLQGAAAAAALSDYGDRRLTLTEALARAAPRFPLVFLLGVLAGLGILLGTIALVVPGILLALAWSVGGIVATVENAGFKSFGRSAELTRGNRISIFLIFVVYAIASLVLTFVARAVGGAAMIAAGGTDPLWVTLGLQPLASAAVQVFSTATLVSAYVELRGVKEGLAAASLATLFD